MGASVSKCLPCYPNPSLGIRGGGGHDVCAAVGRKAQRFSRLAGFKRARIKVEIPTGVGRPEDPYAVRSIDRDGRLVEIPARFRDGNRFRPLAVRIAREKNLVSPGRLSQLGQVLGRLRDAQTNAGELGIGSELKICDPEVTGLIRGRRRIVLVFARPRDLSTRRNAVHHDAAIQKLRRGAVGDVRGPELKFPLGRVHPHFGRVDELAEGSDHAVRRYRSFRGSAKDAHLVRRNLPARGSFQPILLVEAPGFETRDRTGRNPEGPIPWGRLCVCEPKQDPEADLFLGRRRNRRRGGGTLRTGPGLEAQQEQRKERKQKPKA